jgi:hypothetical protein
MRTIELKLKQASAVLGVPPKELQNLVQLKVLRPPRRDNFYWFDKTLLLEAKLAFYLKDSLGTSTELLARFTEALSRNLRDEGLATLRYLWLRSRPSRSQETIEVRIPLRNLAKELEEQLPRASVYKDLPRGRKRPGWKRDFLRSLKVAAGDLSDVAESKIAEAVRGYRAEKRRMPEVSVGGPKKRAEGRR